MNDLDSFWSQGYKGYLISGHYDRTEKKPVVKVILDHRKLHEGLSLSYAKRWINNHIKENTVLTQASYDPSEIIFWEADQVMKAPLADLIHSLQKLHDSGGDLSLEGIGDEVASLMIDWQNEVPSTNPVYWDWSDGISWAWNEFIDCLTVGLINIGKGGTKFYIEGKNLDWRASEGWMEVDLVSGEELMAKILPQTQDFTARAEVYESKIVVIISHHDCPTGSVITVKRSKK